jgi:hypothetical protein
MAAAAERSPEESAMRTRSFPRQVVPLLLAATLAAPWSLAAEPRRDAPHRASAAAASARLPLLAPLWSLLTSVWGKEGCHIDPNGRCVANPDSGLIAPADTGCNIDPSGCAAAREASLASPADEGCHLDPSGCQH